MTNALSVILIDTRGSPLLPLYLAGSRSSRALLTVLPQEWDSAWDQRRLSATLPTTTHWEPMWVSCQTVRLGSTAVSSVDLRHREKESTRLLRKTAVVAWLHKDDGAMSAENAERRWWCRGVTDTIGQDNGSVYCHSVDDNCDWRTVRVVFGTEVLCS